jgi:hypothetical protein
MPLKRLYKSVSCARDALYTGFSSPSFGITWSILTFLSGLAYLIYNDHKRRNNGAKRQQRPAELENSGTAATQVDSFNSDL